MNISKEELKMDKTIIIRLKSDVPEWDEMIEIHPIGPYVGECLGLLGGKEYIEVGIAIEHNKRETEVRLKIKMSELEFIKN